jgi:hypothetical protein
MTQRRDYPRARDNPLGQRAAVRGTFPQFECHVTRRGGLEWRGTLQPTLESPQYCARILHEGDRTPRVFVDRPPIRRDAPHRYSDGSLCLYWPNEWGWTPRESLAETIIPWTAFWLYYYELWLATDEWLGPSSPHGLGSNKEAA